MALAPSPAIGLPEKQHIPAPVKDLLWKYVCFKETLSNSILLQLSQQQLTFDLSAASSAKYGAYCTFIIAFLGTVGQTLAETLTTELARINLTINISIAAFTLLYAILAHRNRQLQSESTRTESRHSALTRHLANLFSWEPRFVSLCPDKYYSDEFESFRINLETWASDINNSVMHQHCITLPDFDEASIIERSASDIVVKTLLDHHQQLIQLICGRHDLLP